MSRHNSRHNSINKAVRLKLAEKLNISKIYASFFPYETCPVENWKCYHSLASRSAHKKGQMTSIPPCAARLIGCTFNCRTVLRTFFPSDLIKSSMKVESKVTIMQSHLSWRLTVSHFQCVGSHNEYKTAANTAEKKTSELKAEQTKRSRKTLVRSDIAEFNEDN